MVQKMLVCLFVACVSLSTVSALPAVNIQDLGNLGNVVDDLTSGLIPEIIDVGEAIESGLEELEGSASGLPGGSALVELIQTLLKLLQKELGELEGSGNAQ